MNRLPVLGVGLADDEGWIADPVLIVTRSSSCRAPAGRCAPGLGEGGFDTLRWASSEKAVEH